jgi:DNA/RNA-binding domain of Phe-tRNA-synthetase-like protein
MTTMPLFHYDQAVLAEYPAIQAGLLFATGLRNGPTPPALQTRYTAEQATVNGRLPASLSDIPALAAWRSAFRRFGVNPTQYRCAPEALLRRLAKAGDIPSINMLVDLGNLVSIRYALPVAVLDWRAVTGTVTVHRAIGNERFIELGSQEAVHPEPGEVVFSDATGMVLARRWCWRQSAESAAQPDTTTALIVIEAHHADGPTDVANALADLRALLADYGGGQYHAMQLDAQHPTFALST